MANQSVSDFSATDDGIFLGKLRSMTARSAMYEIDQLSCALRKLVQPFEQEELVRGVTGRIEELAALVMGALSDDCHKTEDLYLSVYREPLPETESNDEEAHHV